MASNYATEAELKARYLDDAEVSNLTLDEETGVPDTAVLNEVLENAEGEINAYLALRYLVPVSSEDRADTILAARLRSLTLDLATYALELRTGHVAEVHTKMRDDAIAFLEKLSTGELLLPATDAPSPTTSRADTLRFGTAGTGSGSLRLFTRATQGRL